MRYKAPSGPRPRPPARCSLGIVGGAFRPIQLGAEGCGEGGLQVLDIGRLLHLAVERVGEAVEPLDEVLHRLVDLALALGGRDPGGAELPRDLRDLAGGLRLLAKEVVQRSDLLRLGGGDAVEFLLQVRQAAADLGQLLCCLGGTRRIRAE